MKSINAVIQLRRDNDFNFDKIKTTFIPANGEVVLVDTAQNGLRAKVGDGVTPYAGLVWADARYRDTILYGYYKDDIFYSDANYQNAIPANINKLYIDFSHNSIYYFNGMEYIKLSEKYSGATALSPGVVKLYNETGNNIDGTMTQRAITSELNERIKFAFDSEDESLIFI